jgi:hypothetical protein
MPLLKRPRPVSRETTSEMPLLGRLPILVSGPVQLPARISNFELIFLSIVQVLLPAEIFYDRKDR